MITCFVVTMGMDIGAVQLHCCSNAFWGQVQLVPFVLDELLMVYQLQTFLNIVML